MEKIKIAFYSAMDYDISSFNQAIAEMKLTDKVEMKYLASSLTTTTAHQAAGKNAICIFVNDDASAKVLEKIASYGIKIVFCRCAGFDMIDLKAAARLGMEVVRVPAYSPYAVAEHAMALLMTLNRKLHKAYNRVRDANFTLGGLTGFDLHGKTVGVIGTGKIGQCFIQIALGYGCNVLAYDVYPSELVKSWANTKYVEIDELLAQSDVISLHAPATPETTNIINRDSIAKMKQGVFLVNTSRGALVDTKALLDGLLSKKIGGAGLDVYHNEKPYFFRDVSQQMLQDEILARLINLPNVLVTSHQAFLTNEALGAIATVTLTSFQQFFFEHKKGADLTYRVES